MDKVFCGTAVFARFPKETLVNHSKIRNERPFRHICRNGTDFRAARCDFVGGVHLILGRYELDEVKIAQDVAQAVGYHAVNILPNLNGFAGYDCIQLTIERGETKPASEWQKEVDFTVIDPDGWRGADIPWEHPISRSLFDKLAAQSTLALSKRQAASTKR